MTNFLIQLNAKVVATYATEKACEKKFNEYKAKYPASKGNSLHVYRVDNGTYYNDFPLTEENEWIDEE